MLESMGESDSCVETGEEEVFLFNHMVHQKVEHGSDGWIISLLKKNSEMGFCRIANGPKKIFLNVKCVFYHFFSSFFLQITI